jgi:hypothetical protein
MVPRDFDALPIATVSGSLFRMLPDTHAFIELDGCDRSGSRPSRPGRNAVTVQA